MENMFEHKYPNENLHELDLTWLIKRVTELKAAYSAFLAANSLTFADPILWDITKQYSKNTIVLSPEGDAYLSKKVVDKGIQLNNSDYWLEIFNFAEYVRTANSNLTRHVEQNTTRATDSYAVNDWLLWDDVLYKVTSAISADDLLTVGTNLVHFTVEDFCRVWQTYMINTIAQYKSDIDASELAYKQQLDQTVLNYKNDIDASELAYKNEIDASELAFTTNLQQQFDAAIAGATVDSEVVLARTSWRGVIYSTLSNALNNQFYDIFKRPTSINYLNKNDMVADYWFNILGANATLEPLNGLACAYVEIDRSGVYQFKYPVNSVGSSYKCALFNADKTFNSYISGTLISGSGNNTIISVNITDAMFTSGVRFIGYNQAKSKINDNDMIVIGNYPNDYIEYNNYLFRPELKIFEDQIVLEDGNTLSDLFDYPTIVNYLNPVTSINRKWINNVTHATPEIESISYMFYNMVEIDQPGTYYMKYPVGAMGTNNYKVPLYDTNGDFVQNISGVFVSGSGNDTLIALTISSSLFNNSNVRYIGYNQASTHLYLDDMITLDSYPADYVPFNFKTKTSHNLRVNTSQIICENPLEYLGRSVSIFTKGFFAGDSLTMGTFNRKSNGATIWEVIRKYSYPAVFQKLTGVTASNWGIGGESTKTYYEAIINETIATDYDFVVIALGANDLAAGDINESREYYQLLIDHFKSLWQKVKIFCCTVTPAYTETSPVFYEQYNDMVRSLAEANSNCFLIDLAAHSKCKLDSAYANGHLTAIGYAQQAQEVANAISYYINNEPYNFNDVQFIGTDYNMY